MQADGRFCLTEPTIFDLHNKTLGIIGVGNIAHRLSTLAKAFGMKVLWAERRGKTPRSEEYTDFDTVLAESDIISLHTPLTDETHHLINKKSIAKMVKKPLLMNLARGPIVDPQAIVDAINQNLLMGFVTDVFEAEPPEQNDPLLTICHHPRVLYTPHVAWASEFAQKKLWTILQTQISNFIKNY